MKRTLDFNIGKQSKFLSDPDAARDGSGRCTTSSSIVEPGAREQQCVPISRNFNWLLAIWRSKSNVPNRPHSAVHQPAQPERTHWQTNQFASQIRRVRLIAFRVTDA